MNGFLIFLAVALWFGLKVRKAYQKQMSELGGGTPSDEGTVKNAFESLFDDRQEAKPSNASSPFSSEVGSAGYFSYETEAAMPLRDLLFSHGFSAVRDSDDYEGFCGIISIFPKYNPLKLINPL